MTRKARLLKLFVLLHLFVILLLGVWLYSQSSQDYTEWVGSKAASTVHVVKSSLRDTRVSADSIQRAGTSSRVQEDSRDQVGETREDSNVAHNKLSLSQDELPRDVVQLDRDSGDTTQRNSHRAHLLQLQGLQHGVESSTPGRDHSTTDSTAHDPNRSDKSVSKAHIPPSQLQREATSKLDHVASMDIGRAQDSTTTGNKNLVPHRGDQQLGRERLSNNSRVTQVVKTVLPSQLPSKPSSSSHTVTQSSADLENQMGHALSLSFSDQMTFSTVNLLSLQCWAGLYNMRVPEPFLIDSYFRAPLRTRDFEDKNAMKLSDVYDLEHWNDCIKGHGYATLTKWEEFISSAPRDVLLVYLQPYYSEKLCPLESVKEAISKTLQTYEFRIVREVCLGKLKRSQQNFTRSILGNYSTSDVTIIFQEWSLQTYSSVARKSCAMQSPFQCIKPSWKVSEDVQSYLDRYLNSREYVAAMMRSEKMVYMYNTESKLFSSCFNKTIMLLDSAKQQAHINSTFVTIDVGKYGSKSNEKLTSEFVQHQAHLLYKAIYGSPSSLENWENTFEKVSHTRNSGYIAFMQKIIASRAECLILVGGGSFHKHTLEMYRKHREQTSRKMCYVVVNSRCTIMSSEGLHFGD